ncbi:RNA-binding domain-containing protein [Fistulina hepatica ATCC 64428]|nr:RNA-binding domain-containing protein [Fistulina hepatica ATCC 64428]
MKKHGKKPSSPSSPTAISKAVEKPVTASKRKTISTPASEGKLAKRARFATIAETSGMNVASKSSPAVDNIRVVDDVAEEQEDNNDDVPYLHGFSSDDEDSSDEEPEQGADVDVGSLPIVAKDDVSVRKRLDKAKKQPLTFFQIEEPGVIYLGRLPHGFFEAQLRAYFSQFGNIARLRISRNKKTGASKHYGFIEFESAAVAQVVAETMDNYLLLGHLLQCKVIPTGDVHARLWVGANRMYRPVPKGRVARVEHNKPRTAESQERATKRLLRRQRERKRKLEALGISYDIDSAGYKSPEKADVVS